MSRIQMAALLQRARNSKTESSREDDPGGASGAVQYWVSNLSGKGHPESNPLHQP
jgi:hypothetical protein